METDLGAGALPSVFLIFFIDVSLKAHLTVILFILLALTLAFIVVVILRIEGFELFLIFILVLVRLHTHHVSDIHPLHACAQGNIWRVLKGVSHIVPTTPAVWVRHPCKHLPVHLQIRPWDQCWCLHHGQQGRNRFTHPRFGLAGRRRSVETFGS